MAENNPWAVVPNEPSPWAVVGGDPTAADYAIDAAKAAPAGLAKGVIGVAGTGGDLAQVAKAVSDKATEKGLNPFSFLSKKFEDSQLGQFLKASSFNPSSGTLFDLGGGEGSLRKTGGPSGGTPASGDMPGSYRLPSSSELQKEAEKATGPIYNAKYGLGKAVETGTEIAPLLLGNPARAIIAKSIGAGATSELAGEGAVAIKDKLPEKLQPWAEPTARAIGAFGGTLTPAGVRKAITPLPMSDDQFALVQALKKTDPEFVKTATAGQLTQSPRLMGMEARSMGDQAEKQGKAFTEATMARGEDTGKKIGNIYDTNSITSAEFPALNQAIAQEKRKLSGVTGTDAANAALGDIQKEIRLGAMNSPQNMSMTGKRYQYMRDRLQGMIEGENNNTVKKALTNTKTALDAAFDRSIPNAGELAELRRQKQTFEALANRVPTMDNQVTPESVLRAAAHAEGNKAVNTGRSPLANWARDAEKIMPEHPAVSDRVPPWFDLTASTVGALLHGGAGAGGGHAMAGMPGALLGGSLGGAEGGVFSHLLAPSIYQALAGGASKLVSSTPAQKILGNQFWRPGSASSVPSKDDLVRLLMSPTVQGGQ